MSDFLSSISVWRKTFFTTEFKTLQTCSAQKLLHQQLFLLSSARHYISLIMYAMINRHLHFKEFSMWLAMWSAYLLVFRALVWRSSQCGYFVAPLSECVYITVEAWFQSKSIDQNSAISVLLGVCLKQGCK